MVAVEVLVENHQLFNRGDLVAVDLRLMEPQEQEILHQHHHLKVILEEQVDLVLVVAPLVAVEQELPEVIQQHLQVVLVDKDLLLVGFLRLMEHQVQVQEDGLLVVEEVEKMVLVVQQELVVLVVEEMVRVEIQLQQLLPVLQILAVEAVVAVVKVV